MTLKFTGDETLSQVFDLLLTNAEALYGQEIRLTVLGGASYQGEFAGKGSRFVVLRTATGRYLDGGTRSEVVQTHLIATEQVIGISFETLEAKE